MERYPPPFTEKVATKTSVATNSATLISLCFQRVGRKGSEVATSEAIFFLVLTGRQPEVATKTSAATISATLISLFFQWVAGKGSEVATSEPLFLGFFEATISFDSLCALCVLSGKGSRLGPIEEPGRR